MQTIYLSKGKELLKLLINNGFEGYFVGECVRNTIMNIDFARADIITNAKIEDLKRLNNYIFIDNATIIDENTLKVVYSDYDFYFKSFSFAQNEISDNRSKLTKHYSSNLLDELSAKDFTIDAIAMSYSGKITDAYNGIEDIKAKRIRTIASPKIRFVNHPLDILEAIRLVGDLKFNISDKTYSAMVKKSKILLSANKEEIYEYMDLILKTPNFKKAFAYLVKDGIYKNIPALSKGIKAVAKYKKSVNIEELLLTSFVLNGDIDNDYMSYIKDNRAFESIFNVTMANKKGLYDPMTLFINGLDVCLEANFINYLASKDHLRTKTIKKDYEELKIKSYDDLAYKDEEVARITKLDKESDVIKEIINNVVLNILNETLDNTHDEIERFVLKELTTKGIYFDLNNEEDNIPIKRDDDEVISESINADYSSKPILTDDEQALNEAINNVEDDYTNHRLRMLEERLDEQSRMLQEKNERLEELENQNILETTSKLIKCTKELIKQDTQINSMIKDIDDFELEYRNFIVTYLEKEKKNKDE